MKVVRPIAYLIAGALLGLASPSLAATGDKASVRAGIEAWQSGDYKKAVGIWRPLSDKGDPAAQFNLAQAYRVGRGVDKNDAAARALFEKAADQGHLAAQTTLGLMLYQGGDQLPGLKWLKIAAEQGEPRAALVYGTALINGDGVTQDRLLGYAYVYRAAGKGLRPAKATLESIDGLFSDADRKKALALIGETAPRKKPAPTKDKPRPVATPKSMPSAPSSAPASGAWRIQLGAFARPGGAQALYQALAPSLGGRTPYYLPAGKVTRLQVGPYETRAAAAAACTSLKARNQPCLIVRAP